ncbi:MAG: MFS transporter [Nitrospira sp.]|nr:MFS transporter [Nitrospira sp.]MDH4250725.1 MFS transporter [Nitrospira sp.]MDH5336144.1 MFS transporter [Nitrospira sp.]
MVGLNHTRLTGWAYSLGVKREEFVPLVWAFVYFFCLLCGYSILRPVRDEMAIEGGLKHLPWMMTATFLTMLAATPLFGWLSARCSRYRLLLTVYAFFILNLLAFYMLMMSHLYPEWVARSFFVWLSVMNLFIVSVFWSFMADLFTPEQGARLFGVIAAGGSSGALVGPLITTGLTFIVPVPVLMLASMLFLTLCLGCVYRLDRWGREQSAHHQSRPGDPLRGSFLAGIRLTMSSPYLLGICGYLAFLTMTATFLYLEQTRLVSEYLDQPEARTRLFSSLDFTTGLLTWLTQMFVTKRVISRFGLVAPLLFLPVISLIGFLGIALWPTLGVYVVFSVLRRVGEYALSKPAREVLFTVVSREEKYKAKNFIDTAISRGGDASTGWLVTGVRALGATTAHIALACVPLMIAWAWLATVLAREEKRRSAATVSSMTERPHPTA